VTYAALTESGIAELKEVMPRHYDALEVLMLARLSAEEVDQLAEMLERLAGGIDDEPCEIPDGD